MNHKCRSNYSQVKVFRLKRLYVFRELFISIMYVFLRMFPLYTFAQQANLQSNISNYCDVLQSQSLTDGAYSRQRSVRIVRSEIQKRTGY